jgi:hypothetical protein
MKMTMCELMQFWREWLKDRQGQRFGQYVCNKKNITNSRIFYSESPNCAFGWLAGQYTTAD